MGAARRGGGRLPRRVYWFRRAIVLAVVVGLVVGIAHLVGGTGVDEAATEQAGRVSATPSTAPAPTLVYGPTAAARVKRTSADVAPAEPTGECDPQDITALPTLERPEAGGTVRITVSLAGTQPACTFQVGPRSLVAKVTDDEGRDFWRSQDCPAAVPREEVVVRSAEPTEVTMRWNGRSSDRGCGDFSTWALPGFYDVLVSVQGSQPAELRFELLLPSVTYVTETPTPTAKPKRQRTPRESPSPSESASPESPRRTPTESASPRG